MAGKADEWTGGIGKLFGGKLEVFFPKEHDNAVPEDAPIIGDDDGPMGVLAAELARGDHCWGRKPFSAADGVDVLVDVEGVDGAVVRVDEFEKSGEVVA